MHNSSLPSWTTQMLSSSSPGLNRLSPSCSSINTICRHSSRNRGFSKWPKTLQVEEQKQFKKKRKKKKTHTQTKLTCLPDIFQHIQDLRRQIRALHFKLCQISFQQGGRGFLGLQGGRVSPDPQNSVRRKNKQTNMYFKNKTLISPKALSTQYLKMCSFVILAGYVQNFGSFSYALWLL